MSKQLKEILTIKTMPTHTEIINKRADIAEAYHLGTADDATNQTYRQKKMG